MTGHTENVRRQLIRVTIVPGWVILVAVTLLFAAGLTLPLEYQFVPLVASVALLGLPHGAVDHLAPTRVRGRTATGRSFVAVGALYAVVGGLYAVIWFVVPIVGFVSFIMVTWLHWGQGEVHSLLALLGLEHLGTPSQRALTGLARGTLPMLVPLVAFPDQYQLIAKTLVGLFAASTLGPIDIVFSPTGRFVVGLLVTTLLIASLAVGYHRATRRRDWIVDVAEVCLLVGFFALVPPILAVGLYFTCWHSLRHIGRLLAIDPGARRALNARQYGTALARFGRDAAPLTAISLAFLGIFYWFVPVSPGTLSEWVGLYLVLIAALTVPHVVVVTWLDYEQDVWTAQPVQLTE
ncbi:Brp/Blh family beta-carotene 15,15'-dioxygenase [Halovenus rubra]|uniref:Brp/Blh family beta-carotene 15,15'-dioxygenase n=2 Tax=Halovenus rubra TaxID=869890 RepID=A0ACC7E1Z2_9EURY|nr:Brp/Blh family beta-carotene 15,15'-dioxygenase [Halovenus rubra]